MIDSVSCLLLTGAQAFSSLPPDALPRQPFTCEGHTTTYEGETVMWRRNSKARRLGWSSLLGILLCLATVSGGLVTAAGGAALAASSTALPDVTALPASPATTTPSAPRMPASSTPCRRHLLRPWAH